MKRDVTIKVINETISDMLSVADEVIGELEYQFEETRNPEKLIGKPYETWTAQDFQMLGQVYGEGDNSLSRLIFNKSYEEVLTLEESEL